MKTTQNVAASSGSPARDCSQFIPCLNELIGRKIVSAVRLTAPACGIALQMDNGKIAVISASDAFGMLSCGVEGAPDKDELWAIAMAGWLYKDRPAGLGAAGAQKQGCDRDTASQQISDTANTSVSGPCPPAGSSNKNQLSGG